MRRLATLATLTYLALPLLACAADLPKMKFNDVKEVAPGVFFRYSAISPTDPSIFGGSNNIWVIFEDYVVVIDANFPKEAEDVLAAIRKSTTKPVRYVLDTHHHGDHAYGNAVWTAAGASIVAHVRCAELLRTNGPKEFAEAGKGPQGRKDVAASTLKVPTVVFDNKLVLDDGKQRVEFLFLGHAHTPGDAVAYLPRQKILCTGDACVNGAYNFMGHSDSASWVRALERMQGLDVELVLPGHGPVAGKDLLARQKRYFAEMRAAVRTGINAGKELEDIIKGFKPDWYREWTAVDPAPPNVTHVYDEMIGRVPPANLVDDFDIHEGPSPTKDTPGWVKPKKIIVPAGLMPQRLGELKRLAPEVEFVPVKNAEGAVKEAAEADAVLGFVGPEVIKASKKLRWVQTGGADSAREVLPALKGTAIVLTQPRPVSAVQESDEAFGLLFELARTTPGGALAALRGRTMLVVGLGSTGQHIARRARALGMRVLAADDRQRSKPDTVERIEGFASVPELLKGADVVVLACPATEKTRGLVGEKELAAMKKTAYLIDVSAPGVVDRKALLSLEKNALGGIGSHESWGKEEPHVRFVVSPAQGPTPESRERQWRLFRENIRRFVAGERLLFVVSPGD
jgi:phosphoglycerate dehydrogenase-like enzyme/glyoxylase-like metal-dependent hydrolase (beta-lactamase superfamily II)